MMPRKIHAVASLLCVEFGFKSLFYVLKTQVETRELERTCGVSCLREWE